MSTGDRKCAAITAAVDAIEGEPGGYVTWASRRHLYALYDRAFRDGVTQAAAITSAVADIPDDTETNRVHRCSNDCEHAIRAVDSRNQRWTGSRPS